MRNLSTPCTIGPITLRNPLIRSAAFENMGVENAPSPALLDYHESVAQGGAGMTTVAYAAVSRSGLSFDGQLWMREEIIPSLQILTQAIHSHGCKASIQIGHCGNMTHYSTCGQIPIGASSGFNIYSPTIVRGMREDAIKETVKDFANSIRIAKEAGFDCVEIHAGHGYLISQFLSPYTNKRKDGYGGSLDNRMRFMEEVVEACLKEAKDEIAIVVKTNMFDGFKSGLDREECLLVAKRLENLGVDALVLSAGFVSKAPMVVMGGSMPFKTLTHYMSTKTHWWLQIGVKLLGKQMIPSMPYKDLYFLEDALYFKENLNIPLIYVGGVVSRDNVETVLDAGFRAVQMGRALVHDTQFCQSLLDGDASTKSGCKHSNYCIARMYSKDMLCHHKAGELPNKISQEILAAESKNAT